MEEMIKYIACALVDKTDEVQVTRRDNDEAIILELHVAPEDMGKVIGKQGRIAKAIRTLVKAGSGREDKKILVDIV